MKKIMITAFMIALAATIFCLTVWAEEKTVISEITLTGSEEASFGHHVEKLPLTAPEGAAYAEDIESSAGWQWYYAYAKKWEKMHVFNHMFPSVYRYSAVIRITDGGYVFAAEGLKITVDGVEWTADAPDENGNVTIYSPEYTVTVPEVPYTDVDPEGWYITGIAFAHVNGIMEGTGDNRFSPDIPLSRGMTVTILYTLNGKPEVTSENVFGDVAPGSWYEKAISWAYENGIVSGIGNGKFAPDENVTREQLALILYKYALYIGRDNTELVYTDKAFSAFGDADDISPWAHDAVLWAMQNGMMTGSGLVTEYGVYDRMILPKESATRAQAAMMIMRFIGGRNIIGGK
ncbi:MAG: S-layer homology domain-containing protein [Clostridia bacterium]|nr:S-layer homology domain-containing protein [Clostridia bacterium]